MNTKENNYGLYVGMELPAEVISEWEEINNNVYNTRHCIYHWHRTIGENYIGDRKIVEFEDIECVLGFLVSGTVGIYLRAEGFKEFLESKTENT